MSREDEFVRTLQVDHKTQPIDTSDLIARESAQVLKGLLGHPMHYEPAPLSEEDLMQFQARLESVRNPALAMNKTPKITHRPTLGLRLGIPVAACLIIGVMLYQPDHPNDLYQSEKSRGVEQITLVMVAEPSVAAKDLVVQLAQLNIEAHQEIKNNQFIVEAFIPEVQQEKVEHLLAPHHQKVAKNGELRIGFVKQ